MSYTSAELNREIFLRNHHHLISPWLFPKAECVARDTAFLIDGWDVLMVAPDGPEVWLHG